jgi:hypothetical protein
MCCSGNTDSRTLTTGVSSASTAPSYSASAVAVTRRVASPAAAAEASADTPGPSAPATGAATAVVPSLSAIREREPGAQTPDELVRACGIANTRVEDAAAAAATAMLATASAAHTYDPSTPIDATSPQHELA